MKYREINKVHNDNETKRQLKCLTTELDAITLDSIKQSWSEEDCHHNIGIISNRIFQIMEGFEVYTK